MYIISIDIGEKNFAYSFLKITREAKDFILEVEDVYLYNVMEKCKQTIVESCCKISDILQTHDDKISECSYILIEQQMRPNIRAQRISQHIWSYLHTKYILEYNSRNIQRSSEQKCKIFSVSSTLKTKMFTQETLTAKNRKKWVINAVLTGNIVNMAKEHCVSVIISEKVLKKIVDLPKHDDVCDTIVQSLVFIIKNPNLITQQHH